MQSTTSPARPAAEVREAAELLGHARILTDLGHTAAAGRCLVEAQALLLQVAAGV